MHRLGIKIATKKHSYSHTAITFQDVLSLVLLFLLLIYSSYSTSSTVSDSGKESNQNTKKTYIKQKHVANFSLAYAYGHLMNRNNNDLIKIRKSINSVSISGKLSSILDNKLEEINQLGINTISSIGNAVSFRHQIFNRAAIICYPATATSMDQQKIAVKNCIKIACKMADQLSIYISAPNKTKNIPCYAKIPNNKRSWNTFKIEIL